MSSIGHIIKLERIKQNLKQVNLAKGICSTSYLSKIEHNTAEASEEVINLLLKRLNIKNPSSSNTNQKEMITELKTIYKEVTIKRNLKYTNEKLAYLKNKSENIENSTFYYLYLVILRLTLSLSNQESSKFYIDFLEQESKHFSNLQMYLLEKIGEFIYIKSTTWIILLNR